MSNLAYALPRRAPREAEERQRHIEIVSTRGQRRARPRVFYALVGTAGLFVILMAQLLLSISLSDGAYQISSLQNTQKELGRDQQTLTEQIQILNSPQNLATRASQLGMVMNNSSRGWLRLSDGAVLATPGAAGAGTAVSGSVIGNVLLTPAIAAQGAAAPASASSPNGGAPASTVPTGSVSSAGSIPAPITR